MRDGLIHINGTASNLYWYYPTPSNWPQPYCKKHSLPIPVSNSMSGVWVIECDDCDEQIDLGRPLDDMQQYVDRKVDGKAIAKLKTVRIDTQGAEVLAPETRATTNEYYVSTKLSSTEGGLQLMIIAGKRDGSGDKVQLFVEPDTGRVNFDRNEHDQHPSNLFSIITATFKNSQIVFEDKPGAPSS